MNIARKILAFTAVGRPVTPQEAGLAQSGDKGGLMIRRRLLSTVLAMGIGLVGLVALSPQAQAACGRFAPGGGKMIESYQSSTKTFTATTYFTFSQDEINA